MRRLLTMFKHDTFFSMRLKLIVINIGALVTIWIILLALVYGLMSNELSQVLDNQLKNIATRTIHSYRIDNTGRTHPISDTDFNFSLWQRPPGTTVQDSVFIDGNPFVSPKSIYRQAVDHPDGYFKTIHIEGIPYRAFFAIVHFHSGDYMIRVTTPTGPTDTTLANLLGTLGVAGFAALILTILVGIWLSSKSLNPTIVSWRRQQQFVADASHELRTPLAIIKTNLEVLLHHPEHTIDSEMHWLGNAYSEVVRTSTLIEDLLTLARADSQEMLIEREVVDISALVIEVGESILVLAEEQEKTLQVKTPEFPCKTLGDIMRLRQLLLILLDNALKYSDPGAKIIIAVRCNTSYVELAVSDTGIGIAPDVVPKIFDRFVRGDHSRHRDKQGSGLGLSIAKWIVDAHHGNISAKSAVGKGTIITVQLPS